MTCGEGVKQQPFVFFDLPCWAKQMEYVKHAEKTNGLPVGLLFGPKDEGDGSGVGEAGGVGNEGR